MESIKAIRETKGTGKIVVASKPQGAEKPAKSQADFPQDHVSKTNPNTYILSVDNQKTLNHLRALLERKNNSCTIRQELPIIDGMTVEFTPDSQELLQYLEKIGTSITPERKVHIPEPLQMQKPKPANPQKLNVATQLLNIQKLREEGLTGKGIGIAVLDTGIAPHPDLKDHIGGFYDMVSDRKKPFDNNRHGTHVSGIIAGNGKSSDGLYTGIAPEATLVGIKVLDIFGAGSLTDIVSGIQTAIKNKDKYNIKVINMSLGGYVKDPYKKDPIAQAAAKAVEKGITVVVSAGNSGPYPGTIISPANSPDVIGVGAMNPKTNGIAWFSSRGPTKYDNLFKPDVVAPGVDITSTTNDSDGYIVLSGTSMASPMVSGTIALLLQKNPDLTPAQIKEILMSTAKSVAKPGYDRNDQGKGLINPPEALKKAQERSN